MLQFCAALGLEVSYVGVTRDTTEADLKQRREIRDGGVFFADQAPVEAAVEGRVLVLEGVEKAERNVLPLLNNLLENFEHCQQCFDQCWTACDHSSNAKQLAAEYQH